MFYIGPSKSRSGGWSASGELIPLDRVKQVTLQVDFPVAEDYTIEFGYPTPPAPLAVLTAPPPAVIDGSPVFTEALIKWSVEGNFVSRRVSVTNGTSVTGTGQACRIVITDASIAPATPVPPGGSLLTPPYIVGVQVAPGTRGNDKQPPTLQLFAQDPPIPPVFLTDTFVVAPLATVRVPVPLDSGAKSVFVNVINLAAAAVPPGSAIVSQAVSAGPGLDTLLKQYDAAECCDWIPLSPGTTVIGLINRSAVASLVFSVTLGIDG